MSPQSLLGGVGEERQLYQNGAFGRRSILSWTSAPSQLQEEADSAIREAGSVGRACSGAYLPKKLYRV